MSRDLPRFTAREGISPAPVDLNDPSIAAIDRFATNFQLTGEEELKRASVEQTQAFQLQAASDIESKSLELQNKALLHSGNPRDQQDFYNANFITYSKTYVNSLPPSARSYATKTFQSSALSTNQRYNEAIIKQQNVTNKLNFLNHQTETKRNLADQLEQRHYVPEEELPQNNNGKMTMQQSEKMLMQYTQANELAAQVGIISPEQAVKSNQEIQQFYQSGRFLSSVENAADLKTKEDLVQNLRKKGLPGYSQDEVDTLAHKGDKLIKESALGFGVDRLSVQMNWKSNLDNALNGKPLNPKFTQDFIALHPEEAAGAEQELNRNKSIYSASQNVVSSPIELQDAALNTIRNENDSQYFKAVELKVKQARNEIKTNAFEFFSNNPAVTQALAAKQMVENGQIALAKRSVPSEAVKADPVQNIILAQKAYGLADDNIQVMSEARAKQFVNNLSREPADERITNLQGLVNQFGDRANFAINQLQKNGLPARTQMVLTAINNPQSISQANNLSNWSVSDPKTVTNTVKDMGDTDNDYNEAIRSDLEKFNNSLESFSSDTTQAKETVFRNVDSYAKYLRATGQATSISDAVQISTDTLVNNNFNYPAINGNPIQVIKQFDQGGIRIQVDTGQLKKAFNVMVTEAKQSNLHVPLYYKAIYPTMTPQELKDQFISDKLSNAYLLPDNRNKRAVLVDASGVNVQLLGKRGAAFVVNYADLADPNSDISREIVKNESIFDRLGNKFVNSIQRHQDDENTQQKIIDSVTALESEVSRLRDKGDNEKADKLIEQFNRLQTPAVTRILNKEDLKFLKEKVGG